MQIAQDRESWRNKVRDLLEYPPRTTLEFVVEGAEAGAGVQSFQRQQEGGILADALPSLGLEHAEGRRRPLQRYNPHEKPITIRGT